MRKVFAEAGIGNGTFFSTEFEEGESEYRVPRFVQPEKVYGYYLRFWLFKTVFILSTDGGFEITKKGRNNLKLLFGIGGESS